MAAAVSVLSVDRVDISRGGRPVVRGLTFAAAAGELVAVMGPSGAGKTTVLRAIAGLDPLDRGRIDVGQVTIAPGQSMSRRELQLLHRQVGFVFQFHHLFANMDALSNVVLAPVHVLKRPPAEATRRARELLARLAWRSARPRCRTNSPEGKRSE